MPVLLSFDMETTGLDLQKDQPIEVGLVLYSTGQHRILNTNGFLVKTTLPISLEINEKTGLTAAAVEKFGWASSEGLEMVEDAMEQADYIIGHNVRRFDRNIYRSWLTREHWENSYANQKIWIDTFADLPYTVPKGQLGHMAADHGFLNLFAHSAVADCETVLKLASFYGIDLLIERAKSPEIVLQAMHSRNDNDKAKKAKFRWNPDNKIWWKAVKECDVDIAASQAPFNVAVRKEFTPEQLEN